jgi:protein-S-isoprenylcysteine O-methyltransferase Ste14
MVRREWLAALGCGAFNVVLLASPIFLFARWDSALAVTYCVFLTLATAFYAIELSASRRLHATLALPRSTDRTVLLLAQVSGVLLLVTFVTAAVERSLQRADSLGMTEVVGAGLIAAGCSLRLASIHRLAGRFRSEVSVPDGYRLETGGVFAAIRHPSEVGLVLISVGVASLMSSFGAFVLTALHLPVLLWRVRLEDWRLEIGLGPEFVAYRRRVAGFIPFVY